MIDTATPATQTSASARRTASRSATLALWAGAFVLLAGTAILAFERGGSGDDDLWRAAAVACAVLGGLALAAPWPIVVGRWPRAAALALTGLAAWTAISISWARIRIVAVDDSGRLLLYAAAFTAAVIVMRSPAVRRVTPWALLLSITAAAVYGLGTRLAPNLFVAQIFEAAGARLAHPITYWNGMGLLSACGLLLSVACVADATRTGRAAGAARAAACAAGVLCGFACFLTLSRGAFAAAVCGVGVIVLLRPRRSTLLATAAVWVPVIALALALLAFPAVRDVPKHGASDQVSQGGVMGGIVIAVALLAGLGAALLLRRDPAGERRLLAPALAGRVALALVAVTLVAVVAVSYASEQSTDLATSGQRLGEAKTFRAPYWRVALGSFADHPLAGVGSGAFRVEWRREADAARGAVDAHSLYFETLGELGLVGGLLLAAFVAALVAGTVGAARLALDDPVLPAAAGVLAAFLVHVGVDWDWELPAVTLPALLMAAAAITRPEPEIRL